MNHMLNRAPSVSTRWQRNRILESPSIISRTLRITAVPNNSGDLERCSGLMAESTLQQPVKVSVHKLPRQEVCLKPTPLTNGVTTSLVDHGTTTTSGTTIRVMQWNLLADGLAQNGDFIKVPGHVLEWKYRLPLILQEIQEARADVCCFQELNHFDDLKKALSSQGYVGVFMEKGRSPACRYNSPPDGLAVFWKQSRLSLCGPPIGFCFKDEGGADAPQCCLQLMFQQTATTSSSSSSSSQEDADDNLAMSSMDAALPELLSVNPSNIAVSEQAGARSQSQQQQQQQGTSGSNVNFNNSSRSSQMIPAISSNDDQGLPTFTEAMQQQRQGSQQSEGCTGQPAGCTQCVSDVPRTAQGEGIPFVHGATSSGGSSDGLQPKRLIIATTHLKAKEGAELDLIRQSQMRQLLEALQSTMQSASASAQTLPSQPDQTQQGLSTSQQEAQHGQSAAGAIPVIVTGDFNTTPGSLACQPLSVPPWKLTSIWEVPVHEDPLVNAGSKVNGVASQAQPSSSQSAAENGTGAGHPSSNGTCKSSQQSNNSSSNAGNGKEFSTWKYRSGGQSKRIIDHMYFSSGLVPKSRWRMLSEDEVGLNALPSSQYPSDHIALLTEFDWL